MKLNLSKSLSVKISLFVLFISLSFSISAQLKAGVGVANITNKGKDIVANDSLYVKALAISDGNKKIIFITVDVVALEEIGRMPEGYVSDVRKILLDRFKIEQGNIFINASHCHGIPSDDVLEKTILAVTKSLSNLVNVNLGLGKAYEDRIAINRRIKLNDGSERDERHAYSMPPDELVYDAGVIDTEVGIISLQTSGNKPLAVLYNYACHPIQGVPSKSFRENTSDYPGYASKVIEKTFDGNTTAFFLQGCAGDVNPIMYKNVSTPRNAETLGVLLGSRILEQLNETEKNKSAKIKIVNEHILLPLADLSETIDSLEERRDELFEAINGNNLNLKSFIELYLRYHLNDQYPSYYAHHYLHEKKIGKEEFVIMDAQNKAMLRNYEKNILTMEEITVVNANLNLLKKHQKSYESANKKVFRAEVNVIKIGQLVLVTFPGELSVQIGLNIKENSPYDHTYVAAYTNGYLYYAPTDMQLNNRGGAQEDSDCILDQGWQKIFENRVIEIINSL